MSNQSNQRHLKIYNGDSSDEEEKVNFMRLMNLFRKTMSLELLIWDLKRKFCLAIMIIKLKTIGTAKLRN